MSQSEFHLISSDSHVTMPDEAWQEYLSPEFRDRAPVVEETEEGVFRVFEGTRSPVNTLNNLAGKKPEDFTLNVRKLNDPRAGASDPAERIKDMDIDGVDAEVLYVGGPLASRDPALRLDSVRGYNNWLSDFAVPCPQAAPGHGLRAARHPRDRGRRTAAGGPATGYRRCVHPIVPGGR